MAINASKTSFFQFISKRHLANAAPQAAAGSQIETATLPNKTVVCSTGNAPKGLVKVAVAYRAGSRYESSDNYGISHILRSAAGLTTSDASKFAILRNLQHAGTTLSAISDRETIAYLIECNVDNAKTALDWLKKAISSPEFRPWELADIVSSIKYELATIPPQAKVVDLIHKAAFRHGLGNSIFVREENIKKIGSETLQHYVCSNFVSEKAAVSGCGVPLTDLLAFAESLKLCEAPGTSPTPATYFGGEMRMEKNTSRTHTIIAGPSSGLNDTDGALAAAVLRYAVGGGSSVKRGAGSGLLAKGAPEGTTASGISVAHSDAGLFGIYVSAPHNLSRKAVEGAVQSLKQGVTEEDVRRGKAQLKADILYKSERCDSVVEDMAVQSLLTGQPMSANKLVGLIDKVGSDKVNKVLQNFNTSKKSLATVGNTSDVPYLDELK